MSVSQMELEFKWSVREPRDFKTYIDHARSFAWRISRARQEQILDSYWDSKNGSFAKLGVKARIRQIGLRAEVTFKGMSRNKNGFVRRLERNIAVKNVSEAFQLIQNRLIVLDGKNERLQLLFRIKNKRVAHTISAGISGSAIKAEVCFDDAIIWHGRQKACLKEIELELKSGSLRDFKILINQITKATQLKPCIISKVATAYKTFKLPAYTSPRMTSIQKRLIFG